MDLKPDPTVLQFTASLVSRRPEDKGRDFVVAYTVDDHSFQVFEKAVPNSGFQGGRFLHRTVCINPETGQTYKASDVYIGAKVNLEGWTFVLQEASEAALRVMEAHPDIFERSDLYAITDRIRQKMRGKLEEMKNAFKTLDPRNRGRVSLVELQGIFKQFGIQMDDQEFLTLFRRFQYGDSDRFEYHDFVDAIH